MGNRETTDMRVYGVTHLAIKTEYVIASSKEEARDAVVGGWDTGDYTYADPENPNELCGVSELTSLDRVGKRTLQRILEADKPISLGPASDTDALRKADVTRLRNKIEDNRHQLR